MGANANGTPDSLTFVGHSTVLVELGGARVLTDPVLRDRVLHIRRHAPMPAPGISEQIDAVLLSHLHHDHLDLPSLRRLGPGVRIVVPRGAGEWLGKAGFTSVEEIAPGETTSVGGVEVAAVQADHKGHRWPLVGPRSEPVGYVLRGRESVYFAGDTDLFAGMHDLAGTIDVALLPVWGWGTSLGSGHLDPRRAAEAAARIRPKRAVPIHWGTLFPIGRERTHGHLLHDPPREFAAHAAELAPAVEVALLEPGESLALSP
jgi:L-ascorbate metabolism protein UlaG (beta-lactamase superfamily)